MNTLKGTTIIIMNRPHNRIIWMDGVRVIAVLMVIIIHSPLTTGEHSMFLSVYNYMSAPSIGLFFMISGALLLPVKDFSTIVFYTKRLSKIGFPLIGWSLFYILVHAGTNELSFTYFVQKAMLIPFTPVEGVLWFVYTLIGLYLLAPIITPWLKQTSQKELLFILSLWAVTLIFPYINVFLPGFYNINGSITNSFFYFSGYLGYFLMGYYLKQYPFKFTRFNLIVGILVFLGIGIFVPVLIYLNPSENVANSLVYNYLTINIALISITIYVVIQKINFSFLVFNKVLVEISKLSFGIYLLHIFILRDVVWQWFNMAYVINPAFQIPLMAILTLLISYMIIKLISILPGSKYIIGI